MRDKQSAVLSTPYVRRQAREQSYQQLWEISNEIGHKLDAVLIQCVCDEATAKARIGSRIPLEGLHSPGNDPAIYDKYAKSAEPLSDDEIEQNPDFSFLSYNSVQHRLIRVAVRPKHSKAIEILEAQITAV